MTTTSTIIHGSHGSVEITVYEDGVVVERIYGSIERSPFVPTPGLDFDRMGWDFDIDTVTIGELAQEDESE